MVSFKEFLNPNRVITKLGAISFPVSTFKEEKRTPHYEMDACLRAYETRPHINSGVKQIVRFIMGGKISFQSSDKKTHEFLNKWLEQRPKLDNEITNGVITGVVTGNIFSELTFKKSANGELIFDNLFNINDASRVYINLDNKGNEDEYWLYEVPIEVRSIPFMGEVRNPKFWKINYVYGSYLFTKMIWAIPINKRKIAHCKLGWSRDGLYGRSFIASAIDDVEVLNEIIKNYAVMARYKALGRKIIQLGSMEDPANIEDINQLQCSLKNLSDEDNIIINKPFKTEPLNFIGETDPMSNQLDFLRRDIGSGITPNYLTPWGNEINRATASEAKIPFALEINSIQSDIIEYYNEVIIGNLRKTYPWLAEDATLVFEKVDLDTVEDKMTYAHQLYSANAITLNEYRKLAGMPTIEGGDVFLYQLSGYTSQTDLGNIRGSASRNSYSEFHNGLQMPNGWAKLSETKTINNTYGIVLECKEEKVLRNGKETVAFVVYRNGQKEGVFYDYDSAMYEIWHEMAKSSLPTRVITEVGRGQFEEQASDKETEAWFRKVKNQGFLERGEEYKVVKQRNIADRILRLVRGENGYFVFDGVTKTQQFLPDERNVAEIYFDTLVEKRTKALDEFLEGELPEDTIIQKTFDEIKRLNAQAIEEIFKQLPQNTQDVAALKEQLRYSEAKGVSPSILPKVDEIFNSLNTKLADIIKAATFGILDVAKAPTPFGTDIEPNEVIAKDMQAKANVIAQRASAEIKTMNDKMKTDVFRMLSDGIASGRKLSDIKQEIKDKYANFKTKENPQDWQIERIVRTELANANVLLKLTKWKQGGFEKVEHLTIIDDRTGEKDRKFNHRIFKIDYLLNNPQDRIPLHPNCRCQYIPYE